MRKHAPAALSLILLALCLFFAPVARAEDAGTYLVHLSTWNDIALGDSFEPFVYYNIEGGRYKIVETGITNWRSSDLSVVRRSQYNSDQFVAVGYGSATISVDTPQGMLSKVINVAHTPGAVLVTPKSVVLHEGESIQLSARTVGGTSTLYAWDYYDNDFLKVTRDGMLTARGHGKGTVRAYSAIDHSVSDVCYVTVLEDEHSLQVSPATAYLTSGEMQQFSVTTHDGQPVDAKFDKVFNHGDGFDLTEDGLVTAKVSGGTGSIYAVDALGRKVYVSLTFVEKPTLITLTAPLEAYLYPGTTGNIEVNNISPGPGSYTFSSSNPSVIQFYNDQIGFMNCLRAGSTIITVRSNFTSAQATLPLRVSGPGEIYVMAEPSCVFLGQKTKVVAYDLGTRLPVSATFWSGDPAIASVDRKTGVVTARGIYEDQYSGRHDETKIFARDSKGRESRCIITVMEPPNKITLTVQEGDAQMRLGETAQLHADVDVPNLHEMAEFDIDYTSDNPAVATVDGQGKVTAVSPGTALIRATIYNGMSDGIRVTVGNADPTWVSMSLGDIALGCGERINMDLYPPIFDDGASMPYSLYSSDRAVIRTEGHLVRAVGTGTATLTLRTYNDLTDSITITVKREPTAILVNPANLMLTVGEQKILTVSMPDGEEGAIHASYMGDRCASISFAGADTLVVKGEKLGSMNLTFTAYNGVQKSCAIRVISGPSAISLDTKAFRLAVGQSRTLQVKFKGNATSYTFSSTNEGVATVDNAGAVTSVGPGKATITATSANGKKASCTVTVYRLAEGIDLSANPVSVTVGRTIKLKPVVLPSDTANKAVKWTSPDQAIATVNRDGVVTGKSIGVVVITATTADGSGVSATITITVLPKPTSLSIYDSEEAVTPLPSSITVYLSEQSAVRLYARTIPEEADDSVGWSTGNSALARVSGDGTVTFRGKTGTVTIKATSKNNSKVVASIRIVIKKQPPLPQSSSEATPTPPETSVTPDLPPNESTPAPEATPIPEAQTEG